MKKRLALLLLLAISMGYFDPVGAQGYKLQLGAFTHPIEESYFKYGGYDQVVTTKEATNIIHYKIDSVRTYQEVEQAFKVAIKKGFKNARIIGADSNYFTTVGFHEQKKKQHTNRQLFIRTIKLENESIIIKEDRQYLEKITKIMKEHPSLKLRLLMPKQLSKKGQKQLQTLSNFFLANHIPSYRMRIAGAHYDFVTAVRELRTAPVTTQNKGPATITLALINVKEEIVLDTFGPSAPKEQRMTTTMRYISSIIHWMKYAKWS